MLFLLSLFPALLIGAAVDNDADPDLAVSFDGTDAPDNVKGSAADDDLLGGFGDDTLAGGPGNDLIEGQAGADVLIGNEGNDAIQGRGQDDTVQGFSGNDWVDGNDGDDLVRGGGDQDVVIGGAGSDFVQGRSGDDLLVGGALPGAPLDSAQLDGLRNGDSFEDIFTRPIFDLPIEDDQAIDRLDGGTGDDLLLFGAGDLVAGGSGEDTFALIGSGSDLSIGESLVTDFDADDDNFVVFFDENATADAAEITVTDDGEDAFILVNGEVYTRVLGAAGELSADDITIAQPGDAPEDPIAGTDGADLIDAGRGDDSVDAGAGEDTVLGGSGDDILNGDGDADIIQGQGGFDRISGNAGDDLLQGRGGDDTLSGNQGDDWVDGNDGDDKVNGGLNSDVVIGGTGADLLSGGEGGDLVIGGEFLFDPLTTEALSALRDGATLEEATGLAPSALISLDDDAAADTLDGGNGDDLLLFGAGDTATGGAGADDFGLLAGSLGNGLDPAMITDFAPDDDAIFIMLDTAGTDDAPEVTVVDDGADALVSVGGEVLARVTGAAGMLTAAQINVVPDLAPSVIDAAL